MSDPQEHGSGSLQAGEPIVDNTPKPRPGALLGAERQSRGWTIEQVANQLNLAPRQIQALEDDHYAALPGMVIARGFVRAYAKLLRMDPAPLVAMMAEESAAPVESIELRRALSATFSESSLPAANRADRKFRRNLIGWLVVLAFGAAIWFVQQQGGLAGLSSLLNMQSAGVSPQQPSGQDGVATGETAPAAVPGADAQGVTMGEAIVPAQDPAAGAAVAPEAPVKQEPVESGAKAVNPNANLILKFREDSWIEIKRGEQVTVIARLVKAGTTEAFEIRPGAELVVGNAAGVDITYRGKPLDLTTTAKNNVARLNLQ